jgi:glycolate oxidase
MVGSEGTLGIVTEVIVRLIPKPQRQRTVRIGFVDIDRAVAAVLAVIAAGVVPAALELVDAACLDAVRATTGPLAPAGTGAMVLIEVDGTSGETDEAVALVTAVCQAGGASDIQVARDAAEREAIWQMRRDISFALRGRAPLKINHDVVVPKARIPELFRGVDRLRQQFALDIACFGHAGDGNIHVNLLVDPADAAVMAAARAAERQLFETVIELEGSISGEHGIGFAKAEYLGLELSPATIDVMRKLKSAFDPHGILNPGKIFPGDAVADG